MKCYECSAELINERKTIQYPDLANVFLVDNLVEKCVFCKTENLVYWKVTTLHKTIGEALLLKPAILTGREANFLRKASGFSKINLKALDLASLINNLFLNDPISSDHDLAIRLACRDKSYSNLKQETISHHLNQGTPSVLVFVNAQNFSYFYE